MGECGCSHIQYTNKIIDKNGDAWLFGVYPSCDYCEGPVALSVWKVPREDWDIHLVQEIPEFEIDERLGMGCIVILDTASVRKAMYDAIIDYEPRGRRCIDDADADVLCRAAFPDLRSVVFASMEHNS